MTKAEHLLTILAEECAEVAQRVSKALRFGIDEVQEGQPLTNAERIMVEFDDLRAAVCMLQNRGLLPGSDPQRVHDKMEKVERLLAYSREMGCLEDEGAAV